MKKRMIVMALTLAMLVSFLPMSIGAEGIQDSHGAHTCMHCGMDDVQWTVWDGTTPIVPGHYCLASDVLLQSKVQLTEGEYVFCLNGKSIDGSTAGRIFDLSGTAKVTVADCTGAGKLTGATKSAVALAGNAEFHLIGCTLSGNSAAVGSAVYAMGDAKVNITNAKITGNTANTSSTLWGQNNVQITVTDSAITGNTAKGTKAAHTAGVFLMGSAKLTVSGVAVIDDNNSAANAADVMMAAATCDTLYVNQLKAGSSIVFKTAATDPKTAGEVIALAENGTQTGWGCDWVTHVGKSGAVNGISYNGTAFLLGHYHGETDYEALSSMPANFNASHNGKHYYLTGDVTLTKAVAVWKQTNVTICLNGHDIKQTGTGVRVFGFADSGNSLTIEDCTGYYDENTGEYVSGGLTSTTTVKTGSVVNVARGNTLTLNGGKIYGTTNTAADGAPVYVAGSDANSIATFTMNGGAICGNNSVNGALYVAAGTGEGSQVIVNGGYFYNNHASGVAGAIYVGGLSRVSIGDTLITDNTAAGGTGAIYVTGGASVHIQNTTITKNSTAKAVGAINVIGTGTQVTIADSTVTDNSAAAGYGAVNIAKGAPTVTVTGKTVIEQNAGGNIHLQEAESVAHVAGMTQGARVGFCQPMTRTAAGYMHISAQLGGADPSAYCFSDSTDYTVKRKEDKLVLVAEHEHCLYGEQACDHDVVGWSSWTDATSLPAVSGNYYLTEDVVLTAAVATKTNANINLCLNGHTVKAAEGQRILTVTAGADVNITDCAQNQGSLTGGSNTYGGAVSVHRGCTFGLYAGKITGNTGTEGGAVYLQQGTGDTVGGIFNMYGGEISGNTAEFGGAVRISGGGGQFQLYGGTVQENTATKYGGGIYASNEAQVNLAGGVISVNTTDGNGGGLFLSGEGTSVTVGGTTISGNKAYAGGGMMAQKGAAVTISDGAITDNYATSSGAGVFTNTDVVLTMTGGRIANNNAANSGGGLFLIMSDCIFSGGTIEGNRADKGGAGLWASGANLTLSGTTFTGNTTSGNGGGMAVGRATVGDVVCYSEVTMTGGKIDGNTARAGGGVLLQNGSKFRMENGTIDGNTATASGGGLFANDQVVLTMTGGSISRNKATNSGGGLYLLTSETTFGGGSIASNYAGKNGGAIWSAGSKMNISGTAVKNNATEKSGIGGGIGVASAGTVHSVLTVTGGEISGNTARAGAGVLLQPNGTLNLRGGQISRNVAAASGGGIFASNDSTINMTGGSISYNECNNHGAGVYQMKATGNFSGGSICNNTAGGSGGGLMTTGAGMVDNLNGTKVYENTARNGGGIVVQGGATLNVDGSEFYKNTVTAYGGGLYLSTKSFFNMKSGKFYENQSGMGGGAIFAAITSTAVMTGGTVSDNTTEADGGGIVARGNYSITGVTVSGNTAGGNGGGVATGKMGAGGWGVQPGLVVENTKIMGNTASGMGGGAYLSIGSWSTLRSTIITDNQSGAEGGGLWAIDDLTMQDLSVTGNTSGGDGYGVYLAPSRYDDHSYFTGLMKMSGDMRICDNNGGDLYLGEMTALTIDGTGLGKNALVKITLDSGVLTSRVYGAYDYEGGNCVYTITQGDRSLTDPEPVAVEAEESQPKQDQQELAKTKDVWLYIIVGVFVIIVGALAVVLLRKKKTVKQ